MQQLISTALYFEILQDAYLYSDKRTINPIGSCKYKTPYPHKALSGSRKASDLAHLIAITAWPITRQEIHVLGRIRLWRDPDSPIAQASFAAIGTTDIIVT